ncbi:uncharacterized protein DFL_001419 [Arthrobotrys flagrans]|uniref:Uncharacterized protein n=1 Tax=Arthrobotrys flagrans TaxID=97331 RepID=A0A437A812_ARTFL|nr:Protein of unknown function DUF3716 [Arthrobotrys flagrans]RVD88976.1 hypothetical protein DFL_001419 [Arthrobotrys flagrans]
MSFKDLFKKVTTPSSQFEDFNSDDEGCPPVNNDSKLTSGPLALRIGGTLRRMRQRKFTSGVKLGLAIQSVGVKARRECDYCSSNKGPFATCRAWKPLGSKCGNCSYDNQICSSGWFVSLLMEASGRSRRTASHGKTAKVKPVVDDGEEEEDEDEEEEEEEEDCEEYEEWEGLEERVDDMDLDGDDPRDGFGGAGGPPTGGAGGAGLEIAV